MSTSPSPLHTHHRAMVFGRLLRGNSGSGSEAGSPKAATAEPPKEADLAAAELEWELVEPATDQRDVEPLVIDDYLVLATGESNEAGAETEADLAAGDAAAVRHKDEGAPVSQQSTTEDFFSQSQEEAATIVTEESAEHSEQAKDAISALTEESFGPSEKASDSSFDGSTVTVDEPPATEPEAPCFRCRNCSICVFKACDVVSANYHAQTSPGYLIGAAQNVRICTNVLTVTYTTGKYWVKDIHCNSCSTVLGITYTDTDNPRNQYKVGKYLVGIDRLILPAGTVHPMDKSRNQV